MRSIEMMIKHKKIIVAPVLLLLMSCPVESKASFDQYMTFVLIWPNTYCSKGTKMCKQPIPQEFKVHGLWLFQEQKPVRNCKGVSFPKSEFNNWNFSGNIGSLWPNLDSRRNDITFWEREWDNYGKCTKMSPENYFYLAIKYAKEYSNIYGSLLLSGVTSASDQPYPQEVLHRAIAKAVGISPQIKCITNKSRRNEIQLAEIRICIDIKGTPFNCRFTWCLPMKTPIIFPSREVVRQSRII